MATTSPAPCTGSSHVRLGSKADIPAATELIRFVPKPEIVALTPSRQIETAIEEIKSVSPAVASLRETEVLPITGECRIVARIAAANSVVIELNLKMQQALADIIHKLWP